MVAFHPSTQDLSSISHISKLFQFMFSLMTYLYFLGSCVNGQEAHEPQCSPEKTS